MKIAAIKALVENHSIEDLVAAEKAILEEMEPGFEIEGKDEGEKLTHIFAALWVQNHMADQGADFKTALRQFTQKVRTSIS